MRIDFFVCALAFATGALLGCGSSAQPDPGGLSSGGGDGASRPGGGGAPGSAGTLSLGGSTQSSSGAPGGPPAPACEALTAGADVEPVLLAFAFDVSGSMGKGDTVWHDRTLKWDPVVAATKTFFSDAASQGLSASLKFFPVAGGEEQSCSTATYAVPDVPMTALPSPAFGAALDQNTPASAADWIGGTPTAFAIRGIQQYIAAQRATTPGRYAIVLVTDGYPQGCGGADDQIATVAADVAEARAAGVETYVIGVANPPIGGAPDVVSNLQQIAVAGGTERAFLIDTGSPAATSAAFSAAIDEIRGQAVSCNVQIPAPPGGRTFDKEKVRVTYTTGGNVAVELTYDQTCTTSGSWRYDDPAAPTQIVLCDASCETVRADIAASLGIEFACEQIIVVPK